jgi:glycosyltransferase involved in cell wall biosynthesis
VNQTEPVGPEISVVIPVYNGARTIGDVVDTVHAALSTMDYEVVLVDDGSSDDSWAVIKELSDNTRVSGRRMLKNYGQHAAVVAGLEASRGSWVVTIDDDGQNDPEDIATLIAAAEEGDHDLMFAERRGMHSGLTRRMASAIVNGVVLRVFNAPRDLRISNYRLMTNDVARRIVADGTQYPYVNGLALEYAGRPGTTPVAHQPHQGEGSRYTIRKLFRLLSDILFSYSIWAYRLVVGIALLALLVGAIVSIVAIGRSIVSDDVVPGWASSVLILSVMSGANLIALTVIGEYVVRTLRQARAPSRYVIEEES